MKALNGALKHHLIGEAPRPGERARAPSGADVSDAPAPLVGEVISPDTVWARTTCGWCETARPVFIQSPRVVDLRCPHCLNAIATMPKDPVAETGREESVRVLDVAEIVAGRLGRRHVNQSPVISLERS